MEGKTDVAAPRGRSEARLARLALVRAVVAPRQIMASVPSCGAVGYWVAKAGPLLEWMRERRRVTIDEVVAWGRERGYSGCVVRNTLAWLAVGDQVRYDDGKEAWVLARREVISGAYNNRKAKQHEHFHS